MLEVNHLTVVFDGFELYRNCQFKLSDPGIYFLEGKNGTGKSTLLKALKGSIRTDIQFCVNQFPQAFDRITYVSSDLIFKYRLTVLEQLLLLNDDPNRIEQVIQDFNLKPLLSKKGRRLSSGEKARVAFVLGVLEDKDVLLIDEIFNHLDKQISEKVVQYIQDLSQTKIIIYTSHHDKCVVDANYKLTIENENILVHTVKKTTPSTTAGKDLKIKGKIKYLKKCLNFQGRFLWTVLFACFSLILIFIIQFNRINANDLYRSFYEQSDKYPFPVQYIGEYASYVPLTCQRVEELDLKSPKVPMIKKGVNAYSASFDFAVGEGSLFGDLRTFVLTDRLADYSISDDELVLSDYFYSLLLKNNSIYYVGDQAYTMFYDISLKVTFFETSFNEIVARYEDVENDFFLPYENDPEYINDVQTVYYTCYLTEQTYDRMEKTKAQNIRSLIENTTSDGKKYSFDTVADIQLIEGRMPENDQEIVLPINYKTSGIFLVTFVIHRPFNSIDTKTIDGTFQVVGYTKEQEGQTIPLYFQNEQAIDAFCNGTNSEDKSYAFCGRTLLSEDILKIRQNGFFFADDYYDIASTAVQLKESLNRDLHVLIIGFVILLLIGFLAYFIVEQCFIAPNRVVLKMKNMPIKLILKNDIRFIFTHTLVFGLIVIAGYFLFIRLNGLNEVACRILEVSVPLFLFQSEAAILWLIVMMIFCYWFVPVIIQIGMVYFFQNRKRSADIDD